MDKAKQDKTIEELEREREGIAFTICTAKKFEKWLKDRLEEVTREIEEKIKK